MEAAKSLPQTFENLVEVINQDFPVTKHSSATEPSGDIVALGETSIEEIEWTPERERGDMHAESSA